MEEWAKIRLGTELEVAIEDVLVDLDAETDEVMKTTMPPSPTHFDTSK